MEEVFDQKLQRTQGNGTRTACNPPLRVQIQEIVANIVVGALIWGTMVVLGEALNGLKIGPLGVGRQTPELHGLDHPVAESGYGWPPIH